MEPLRRVGNAPAGVQISDVPAKIEDATETPASVSHASGTARPANSVGLQNGDEPERRTPRPELLPDRRQRGRRREDKMGEPVPAWIYGSFAAGGAHPFASTIAGNVLPQPRERRERRTRPMVEQPIRWPAVAEISRQPGDRAALSASPVPVVTFLSLCGGVGKTSLVATLGRAFSAIGEPVLLADTGMLGPLPFYFGAREPLPGSLRTFSPLPDNAEAPITLLSYDLLQGSGGDSCSAALADTLASYGSGMHCTLVDTGSGPGCLGTTLAALSCLLLVPLSPDMNSVLSLRNAGKLLGGLTDCAGSPVRPFYLLNRFDGSDPMHVDVRDLLGRQLGDRLLPFEVRKDSAVPAALGEGMTVIDYAPHADVTGDYTRLMGWLRSETAARAGRTGPRSEQ